MSFFAGNNKLHVTRNTRTIEELNTDTIYPDTTFHSNMNVICATFTGSVTAYRANYTVTNADYLTQRLTEQCFEAKLPDKVIEALQDNRVVLVYMGNVDNAGSLCDTAVGLPINIKTLMKLKTDSGDTIRGVSIAPQVTVGGLSDVSFSTEAINNSTLKVSPFSDGSYASSYGKTDKIFGWTANANHTSISSNVSNMLRPGTRYVQYHAWGERWRLSNTSITPGNNQLVQENPYTVDTTGLTLPVFHFIVLNVRFIAGQFQFINVFPQVAGAGIELRGGSITINGKTLTSVKILQSYNASTVTGNINLSNSLVKLPTDLVYKQVDNIPYDGNVSGSPGYNRPIFHKWNSINFTQGAKFANGKLLMQQSPGRSLYRKLTSNNVNYHVLDSFYQGWDIETLSYNSWDTREVFNQIGNGLQGSNTYYRPRSQLLVSEDLVSLPIGDISDHKPFALLDTSNFSNLTIDKDGIKGTFNGKQIPVYNNIAAPTYLIQSTTNINLGDFYVLGDDWLMEEGSRSKVFSDVFTNVGFNKEVENLLIGVRVTDASSKLLQNNYDAEAKLGGGDEACFMDDAGADIYTGDGTIYSIIKMRDGDELILAQGYVRGGAKQYRMEGVTAQGTPIQGCKNEFGDVYVLYTMKRDITGLRRYIKLYLDRGKYVYSGPATPGYPTLNLGLSSILIPQVEAFVTRIQ